MTLPQRPTLNAASRTARATAWVAFSATLPSGWKVTVEGSVCVTITRSVRWRPATLRSGFTAVGVSDRFKWRGERSDEAFKATAQSHKVSETTSISGGGEKKKSARGFVSKRIMCVWFKVSVQSSESLSLVGLCDPGLLCFHHTVCIYLRLPLISSLTAARLKQMRSESCFDWWLSGLWWVPLSSAGWRPLILSSFPQPFSSFLFLPYVPFWFGSEPSTSPFFPPWPIAPTHTPSF